MNLQKETFIEDYKRKMISLYRESVEQAGTTLKYLALGSLMMDYMAAAWHDTEVKYEKEKRKQVYYFSMEFLIGRLMDAALINLGIKSVVTAVSEGLQRALLTLWRRLESPERESESVTGTACSNSRYKMDIRSKRRITG